MAVMLERNIHRLTNTIWMAFKYKYFREILRSHNLTRRLHTTTSFRRKIYVYKMNKSCGEHLFHTSRSSSSSILFWLPPNAATTFGFNFAHNSNAFWIAAVQSQPSLRRLFAIPQKTSIRGLICTSPTTGAELRSTLTVLTPGSNAETSPPPFKGSTTRLGSLLVVRIETSTAGTKVKFPFTQSLR